MTGPPRARVRPAPLPYRGTSRTPSPYAPVGALHGPYAAHTSNTVQHIPQHIPHTPYSRKAGPR
ncbi:hypothetical protein [Streptomyces sp. NPDC057554]|uniref:hypothetical protein n=1 Tax=Streptomycetaceae TaxID=2062 RepID=UPI00131B5D53